MLAISVTKLSQYIVIQEAAGRLCANICQCVLLFEINPWRKLLMDLLLLLFVYVELTVTNTPHSEWNRSLKKSSHVTHTVSEWPVEKALAPLVYILGGKWMTKPVECPGSGCKSGLAYSPPRLLTTTRHSSEKKQISGALQQVLKLVWPDWVISHDQTSLKSVMQWSHSEADNANNETEHTVSQK